ncbi:MAG TPA: hypothetical protein VJ300_03595 [Thermoplasmata archaeon]|nr:hypothetical protein [Thermoplasmata archaeon]
MIPPNVGAPKTVTVTYPGAEEKVRKQFVYLVHLPEAEMAQKKIVSGNRLMIRFKDEVVGEGQAILVEATALDKLSPYDAMQGGYESVEAMRKHIAATVLAGARKPKDATFWKVLYRWL